MKKITEMVNALKEKLERINVEVIELEEEKAAKAAGNHARKLLQGIKNDIDKVKKTITKIKSPRQK
ncbi:MAG: hypothetical protein JW976_02660 [Syntrophaceae bacterium]|nr:hypothetical protein [Syntrophaceae bacterium]